jgi:hypothetical protein
MKHLQETRQSGLRLPEVSPGDLIGCPWTNTTRLEALHSISSSNVSDRENIQKYFGFSLSYLFLDWEVNDHSNNSIRAYKSLLWNVKDTTRPSSGKILRATCPSSNGQCKTDL